MPGTAFDLLSILVFMSTQNLMLRNFIEYLIWDASWLQWLHGNIATWSSLVKLITLVLNCSHCNSSQLEVCLRNFDFCECNCLHCFTQSVRSHLNQRLQRLPWMFSFHALIVPCCEDSSSWHLQIYLYSRDSELLAGSWRLHGQHLACHKWWVVDVDFHWRSTNGCRFVTLTLLV